MVLGDANQTRLGTEEIMNGALRVRQLIDELKKRDPESVVRVWDPYNDRETDEVYVSDMRDGATMLCNTNFGTANVSREAR